MLIIVKYFYKCQVQANIILVCVKLWYKMGLNVIFVLLISSVVIASGKSCENDGNVTAQDIKYFSNSKEFFYM